MNPLTAEWVAKAEGDYVCVQREWKARKNPNHDALCFHAQQCAEKYLKAILQETSRRIDRTHKLTALLDLAILDAPMLDAIRGALLQLNVYSIAFRYLGDEANLGLDAAHIVDGIVRMPRFFEI